MRSKQIEPNLSIFLNISRALAAILVLAGHLRGGLFNSFDQLGIEYQHIVNYLLFFITRIGHECVIIFFVLSGYLVGGNILIDALNKNQDWKKYFIDRLARMWMVLLPALLIGYFLDLYRCEYLNDCFQVTQFNFKTVFGNVFFLQTVFVPFFTSNVALWSLANEFWYYLIFPVFLIPFMVKQFKYLSIIFIIAALFIAYMVMPHIILLFPLWLLGVGIRLLSIPKQFKHWAFAPLIYIALLITVFYSNTSESILL